MTPAMQNFLRNLEAKAQRQEKALEDTRSHIAILQKQIEIEEAHKPPATPKR